MTQTAAMGRRNPATFCPSNNFMHGVNRKKQTTMEMAKSWIISPDYSTEFIDRTSPGSLILNLIRHIISLLLGPILRPKCAITDIEPRNLYAHTDDLNNVDFDAPNMYINLVPDITALQMYKGLYKDSTMPIMHINPTIASEEIIPILDGFQDCMNYIVERGNDGNTEKLDACLSIDTTDFVCTSQIPIFAPIMAEFIHIAEKSVRCDGNGDHLITNLQKLPPAVGPCMQNVVENIIEPTASSENVINVIYNNRCARRRVARKLRKRTTKKINYLGKNRNTKFRQELAQFIHDDLDDIYWNETENCDNNHEISPPASVDTTTEVLEPLPEVVESTRPGCIFSRFFSFGQNTTCENLPWPMNKPLNHHTKVTHIEPKYSFGINEHEHEQDLDTVMRQRAWSECSDDFICFERDSDESDISDIEENEFDDTDTDSEIESDIEHFSTEISPPESGFEEKRVRFNSQPEIHKLHVWKYAYSQARKGIWEQFGRDRERFNKRIQDIELVLAPILDANHRKNIFEQRFNN